MSSIYVSPSQISRFKSDVNDMSTKIRDYTYETNSHADEVTSKANRAISNAQQAIETMNDDLEKAAEVMEHNQELLYALEAKFDKVQKQLSAAKEAYQAAKEAQTDAKNSSSGSTEEERKAHNQAVSEANAAVRSTGSDVSYYEGQLNRIRNDIKRVNSAINQLNNIIYRINNQRREAVNYIEEIASGLRALQSRRSPFNDASAKAINECSAVEMVADSAYSLIKGAISLMSESAGKGAGGYDDDQISMNSPNALLSAAESLEEMKAQTIEFTNVQKENVLYFEEIMGDSIAQELASACLDIGESMTDATASFDDKAEFLREAYRNLCNYLSLANRV